MDRPASIGTAVSAAGHLGLVVWVLFGGMLFRAQPSEPIQMAEVTLMSRAEFDAMMAAAPAAPAPEPVAPTAPTAPEEPAPEAPAPEAAPETAALPQPEPQPEPDPAPDVSELTPPAAVVEDLPPTPPTPPVEEPSATLLTEISPRPKPRPAPRVAPTPSEAPAPEAEISPTAQAETRPDPAPEPEPEPEPVQEAAAPPESTTEIVTEATETDERLQSSAPLATARPKSRPARRAPAPEPEPEPTQTAAAPRQTQSDAVADALAEALAGAASDSPAPEGPSGTGRAPSGPPMTSGEKDALVLAVKQCWNVGALSTDALRTIVTVSVSMAPDGRPDAGSIRMLGYEGGSDASAAQAYEAGRRAILRCGQNGYPLPPEKYEQWRQIEIVFNPEQMRMK